MRKSQAVAQASQQEESRLIIAPNREQLLLSPGALSAAVPPSHQRRPVIHAGIHVPTRRHLHRDHSRAVRHGAGASRGDAEPEADPVARVGWQGRTRG